MSSIIKLRPSDVLAFEQCPKAHALRKEGWRPYKVSANLIFGTLIHRVIEARLLGDVNDSEVEELFAREFARERATQPINFSSRMPPEKMEEMGRALVASFVEEWPKFGLEPVLDPKDGKPFMERRLEVDLGDDVVLSAQFDMLAWDREANLIVVDFKTASSEAKPEFLTLADQLTAYQAVVDAWANGLGLPAVGKVGFVEGLKRAAPKWHLKLAPRRSEEQVDEYLNKVRFVADQIRAGRIFRRSLMAWNSPCGLCDFSKLCAEGSDEGLCKETASRTANARWF